ncbi:MAG: hypothetical protein QOI88_3495 [Gammaproteobacteria bacterium]|nr:hypothetical protein [Gammaproteobacteria bacterium]
MESIPGKPLRAAYHCSSALCWPSTRSAPVSSRACELPAAWQHPLQDAVTVNENMRKRSGDMNADCD